jgi:hypothetical protein
MRLLLVRVAAPTLWAPQTSSSPPGSLAQAATKLGEGKININYAYAGLEPRTNAPVVIFGVTEVSQAAKLLDEVAAQAA